MSLFDKLVKLRRSEKNLLKYIFCLINEIDSRQLVLVSIYCKILICDFNRNNNLIALEQLLINLNLEQNILSFSNKIGHLMIWLIFYFFEVLI